MWVIFFHYTKSPELRSEIKMVFWQSNSLVGSKDGDMKNKEKIVYKILENLEVHWLYCSLQYVVKAICKY